MLSFFLKNRLTLSLEYFIRNKMAYIFFILVSYNNNFFNFLTDLMDISEHITTTNYLLESGAKK